MRVREQIAHELTARLIKEQTIKEAERIAARIRIEQREAVSAAVFTDMVREFAIETAAQLARADEDRRRAIADWIAHRAKARAWATWKYILRLREQPKREREAASRFVGLQPRMMKASFYDTVDYGDDSDDSDLEDYEDKENVTVRTDGLDDSLMDFAPSPAKPVTIPQPDPQPSPAALPVLKFTLQGEIHFIFIFILFK